MPQIRARPYETLSNQGSNDKNLIRELAECGSTWDSTQGSCDEYPFASTMQGGLGAQIMGVPGVEQSIQMRDLNYFYRSHGFYKLIGPSMATQFLVDVVDVPAGVS